MKYYSQELLTKVKQHLKHGGIIAYPTEYCYGFGCNPLNRKALNRVIRLKGRSPKKGFITIASKQKQLKKLIVPLTKNEEQKVSKYWPGPYSILLRKSKKVSKLLSGNSSKLALRVTSHPLVIQLCNYLGYAIVSTSANKSGRRPIKNYRECYRKFGQEALVLPGNTSFAKRPSYIIDINDDKVYR